MSDACSNSQGFGRRGASRGVRTVVATSGIQPRKAALPAGGKADASGEYFVAKFKLVTVLVASGLFLGGLLALPEFWAPPDPHAPKIVSLTPYDWEMFLGATIGLTLIGAMFLVKGLLRGRALVMTDSHVAIFTIVGTKKIRWEDLAQVKLSANDTFGKELQFYANKNNPSRRWMASYIPFYVAVTDKSVEDVMAAVRYFRPDL